jgi:hypothetical protein
MAMDRLRYWLAMVETTQPDEMDCDELFELLEELVATVNAGQDVATLFPAVAVHLQHCPTCQDLLDTLVALSAAS